VLVCGTGFGMMYITAVRHDPNLVLVGVMSRGSETSRQVAAELGVPLFTSLDELPPDIDIACVAVGGTAGHALRLALLRRGVHVLAEHPIYPAPLEEALDVAAASGTLFHLNTHFELLPASTTFIDEVAQRAPRTPPLYGEVLCATPTVFSCLDILRLALGTLQPFAPQPATAWDVAPPMRSESLPLTSLPVVVAGIPISFLVHKGAFAAEGQDIPMSHRISLGFRDGNLLLTSLWGPVVWSSWISPDLPADEPLARRLDDDEARAGFRTLTKLPYLKTRVAAVHHAIERFATQIRSGGPCPPGQDRAHMLEVSRCWDQVFPQLRVRDPE
jgi:pyochelin biosynthesis protein PchG